MLILLFSLLIDKYSFSSFCFSIVFSLLGIITTSNGCEVACVNNLYSPANFKDLGKMRLTK